MTPNTYMCRMSSRDFFRNPASAKKEAETAPVIINEYGTAAFVFLPFVQYEALLQKQKSEANKNDSISAAEGKKSEKNPERKDYKNISNNTVITELSDRLSYGLESVQQEITLLTIDVNRLLDKTELMYQDLQHGLATEATVERRQNAIPLLPNPQELVDGIHDYHDEVMDEMEILAKEAKDMLRSHYVTIPKRAARWSWGLAFVALVISVVLTVFAYGQEQRAAFYYAQAEDAKTYGAKITNCNRHEGKTAVRFVLVKTGTIWKGENNKTAYMEIAR